jgi:hypothetical protein
MNPRLGFWARRVGGFFLTLLGLCALGGLLGGIVFPLAGGWGGSTKTHAELVVVGVKNGAFIFMVWAPGAALVREFIRGNQESGKKSPP